MAMNRGEGARGKGTRTAPCVELTVNGRVYRLEKGSASGAVDPAHTLAHTLRDTLGLTGTKLSCDNGACGCCTVIMEGKPVLSCKILTVECDGKTDNDDRGPERRGDGRSRPAPAGIHRSYRLSVRLLHAGHHHDRKSPPQREPISDGGTGKGSPFGQLLPVHQPLSRDEGRHVGRRARGGSERWRIPTDIIGKATPRRDARRSSREGSGTWTI